MPINRWLSDEIIGPGGINKLMTKKTKKVSDMDSILNVCVYFDKKGSVVDLI